MLLWLCSLKQGKERKYEKEEFICIWGGDIA